MGRFWCSDVLTGNDTCRWLFHQHLQFWCSDVLTGNDTDGFQLKKAMVFWCSDVLTGNDTQSGKPLVMTSFGAVTF